MGEYIIFICCASGVLVRASAFSLCERCEIVGGQIVADMPRRSVRYLAISLASIALIGYIRLWVFSVYQ